jgi:hypothetical protein
MQQLQQAQMMQTLMASTQAAPVASKEPVSRPVGNLGNNIDIRA